MDVRRHEIELSGGVRLLVEDAGEGPALLLLHAGVADRHMWDPQWPWLAERFRVLRWDWRGFGDTPHAPGPFSYAADVLQIMAALGIERATFMGCSFGGSVSIRIAIEHPERVERLVLVGSGLPGHAGENPPQVEELFARADAAIASGDSPLALTLLERLWLVGPGRDPAAVDPAYLARARALLARIDRPDNGAESLDAGWSAADRFASLAMPVLIIVGDEDVPEIVRAAEEMHRQLPGARYAVIEGAAHLPNLERTRAFDAVLAPWLS